MEDNRRPVASRKVPVFQSIAKKLVSLGLTPNEISVMSAVFAAAGGMSMACLGSTEGARFYGLILLGLFGIQLRLICNLIDGLMAVEGGLKTPTGELFNDIPDRFADLFFFVGASISIPFFWGVHIGWAAAALAILTAYVRVLGASMQQGHDFGGPTAKQHRMFILNVTLISAAVEKMLTGELKFAVAVGLAAIAFGSLATVAARISRLAKKLK